MHEISGSPPLATEVKALFSNRIFTIIIALTIIILVGTVAFETLEGFDLYHALFYTLGSALGHSFSVMTRPSTIILVSVIAILEWACIWFAFEEVVGLVSEGRLKDMVEGTHIRNKIGKLRDHHILAGAGRVGREIAKSLQDTKTKLVIIERDSSVVKRMHAEGYLVVHGDIMSEEALKSAGIQHAKVLIAAMGEDADNVFLTLTAKGMNPKIKIIARAEHDESIKKLKQAGASEVIMPSVIGGKAMADASMKK
jgi:voltage-gated potassium channel